MNILSNARNWMKSRQVAMELSSLSDASLADIGLNRSEIESVARGMRRR